MKKGFTLVELMIVMVIVGILVVIALPKYNESLERSRALEGINVLKEVSDAINAQYVLDGNTYKKPSLANIDHSRSKYFSSPAYVSGSSRNIIVERQDAWGYKLTAENSNGMLDRILCENGPGGDECQIIGITEAYNGSYAGMFVMDMSN